MNMIIKKKQLVSVALVLTLSAVVFVNWYFARPGVKSTIDTGKTTANRQVENYFSSIVTQVRMADGFTPDMEWALIGDIEDPLLGCYWEYEMTYGGVEFTQWLLNRYSWWDWIHNYYGYAIPTASYEKIRVLAQSDAVRAMPCWPADGSIQVVGDTVVIKCQELP